MATAHALLSQSRWSGVSLTSLIRHQLAPYTTGANATIRGPDVMVTSAQTQAVALLFHELVTNAAKHGAPVGSEWQSVRELGPHRRRCSGDPDDHVAGAWRPADRGSGPIRPWPKPYPDLIPHELGGTVDLTFPIRWRALQN
jgi:hypothetical protein